MDKIDSYNNAINSPANEYSSLSELVSNHLKNVLPNSLKQNKDNDISEKLKGIQLDDSRQLKSFTNNLQKHSSVDLSNALNVSNSLPNLTKSHANRPEKFEIPFIDCENRNDDVFTPEIETLPCELHTRELKILNKFSYKKASKFGSVMCSTYKHPKLIIKSHKKNRHVINIFTFNTMSPDDYISSHLKK